MPQDKQCEHKYFENELEQMECETCGLLKSTIESMEKPQWHDSKHVKTLSEVATSPKTDWRENIHKTIKQAIYGKQDIGLAQVIVQGIDAAYVAGLDDREKVVSQTEEEILKIWDYKIGDKSGAIPKGGWEYVQEARAFISQAFKAGEALGQQNGMRMVVEMIGQPVEGDGDKTYVQNLKAFITNKYNL